MGDPRGDTTELREERLAMREDPNSLGLSIRATPYQDFNSTELRGPLVSQAKESGFNAAYSSTGNVTTNYLTNHPKNTGQRPQRWTNQ